MEDMINFLDSGTVLIPVLIFVIAFLVAELIHLLVNKKEMKKQLKEDQFKIDRLFEEQRGYRKALRQRCIDCKETEYDD